MTTSAKAKRQAKRNRQVTVAHTPWAEPPPPQDNGPTPERKRHGIWQVGDGTRVQRDVASTPLHHAHALGAITLQLRDAGDAFHELRAAAIKIRGGKAQKDSLDFTPRGGAESSPEYSARIVMADKDCAAALGPLKFVAESFIVDGRALGHFDMRRLAWRNVLEALGILAGFFKIPGER